MTLAEIELAISRLPTEDRAKLVRDLPSLLPECQGDLAWQAILDDPTPSTALTSLVDGVDARYAHDPASIPEVRDSDFDRYS